MGESIWLYDASLPLAIVTAVIYAVPMVWQGYQTIFKYKTYYFLPVFVGAALEVGGYAARAVSSQQVDQIPPYAVQSSLIVLAPLFIGAGSYALVSRLCLSVLPPTSSTTTRLSQPKIYGLNTAKLTPIFVSCDVISFLIQVSGSGIASSGNWAGQMVVVGQNVLIGGLATQVLTFGFFLAVMARFHKLTQKYGAREGAPSGWKRILTAVYISCGLIMIRSLYRLVEFSLGIFGYPFTHEWMFYVFESLPMLPALGVFCYSHPGEFLPVLKGRKNDSNIQMNGQVLSEDSV